MGAVEGFPRYDRELTPPSPSTPWFQPFALAQKNLTVWFARYRLGQARVGDVGATNITIYVGTEKLTEAAWWL